jgi:Cu+-exporting ATPase
MPQVKDPVCGMTIDSATAAGQSSYQGQTYYFCSDEEKQQFDANPAKFVGAGSTARQSSEQRPSP